MQRFRGGGPPPGVPSIFPVACYLNVLIVLDRSDSVKGGFNRSRDFVLNVSQELNIGPHAHQVTHSVL